MTCATARPGLSIYTEQHNRLGGRIGLFVMDEIEGTDIDTEEDLLTAERQLRQIGLGSGS